MIGGEATMSGGPTVWRGACMPYQAIVISVMIASPTDVLAERDAVRDVVHD